MPKLAIMYGCTDYHQLGAEAVSIFSPGLCRVVVYLVHQLLETSVYHLVYLVHQLLETVVYLVHQLLETVYHVVYLVHQLLETVGLNSNFDIHSSIEYCSTFT